MLAERLRGGTRHRARSSQGTSPWVRWVHLGRLVLSQGGSQGAVRGARKVARAPVLLGARVGVWPGGGGRAGQPAPSHSPASPERWACSVARSRCSGGIAPGRLLRGVFARAMRKG